MPLTHEDVERILHIIDHIGYDEIRIECGDLKLYIIRHGAGAISGPSEQVGALPGSASSIDFRTAEETLAAKSPASASIVSRSRSAAVPENLVAVRAPMLGTFYRAPSPGAPSFVIEGAEVGPDDTVCLIEVMKLFNTLRAGIGGRVVQFLVDNGAMVEYDQPLLLIEPKPGLENLP